MKTVRSSLAYSVAGNYAALVLQLVGTVIIARILTPEETGVFAVAAVFAALASTFRDFGVGEFLIQERELSDDTIRASLLVNITVSWMMAVLLFCLAPAAASFYRSPGVSDVMRVQSVNFLLIPFGAVTMAWFRREMNFKPIFIIGLLANIASTVVGIVLALKDFGFMSLAWASLAGVVVTVGTSVCMRPGGFPRWPGFKGVRRVVQFGKFASGIYIFGQIGRGAPEMIIGRAQNMADVGMFNRAYGIVEIFNRVIVRSILPVCLPYFAKEAREEGTPRRALLTTISYLTVIGWPCLAFLGVAAYSAIRLMYGPQWMEAVPFAKILCAATAIELIFYPATEAMLALGRAREGNQLQIVIQSARIIGLLATLRFGLAGACWGLLGASVFGTLVSYLYLTRTVSVSLLDVVGALWPSLQLTLVVVIPLLALVNWMPIDESNYLPIGAGGAVFCGVLWIGVLRFLSHPLWSEIKQAAGTSRRTVLALIGRGG
ncbi:MAG: lipopolysaccharide biosynthesis protein [Methylococcaceae bacterium]|nr:lipopolysaccharide biosynthesis protein [Methylococcaceae bacterium]MCI0734366.1 lipopolysaccharide biosynthesis protein [Methylococcaceae bacterium]